MYRTAIIFLLFAFVGCQNGNADLCHRFFHPYPDLISQRLRTGQNKDLVDAMRLYSQGKFEEAVEGLQAFAHDHPQEADAAWFYSANCYLALGRPYDAELQLDFVENWPGRTYSDETEWYSALCLLCSSQFDRARVAAHNIAIQQRHTYREQATTLEKDLTP